MVGMNHDEQAEAFKLFMQHYNASQRTKEKKPKAGKSPVTMKQRAGRLENNVQAENVTINQTSKNTRNVIGPKPGTIGYNKPLWLMIKAAHEKLVQARLKHNKYLERPHETTWGIFRNAFHFDRNIKPSEWVQSQDESRAPEFLKYFEERYRDTQYGKTKNAQKRKGGIIELHDERRKLCAKLNLSDDAFHDFLFKFKGVRSSTDLSLEEYAEILNLLKDQTRYMGQ